MITRLRLFPREQRLTKDSDPTVKFRPCCGSVFLPQLLIARPDERECLSTQPEEIRPHGFGAAHEKTQL